MQKELESQDCEVSLGGQAGAQTERKVGDHPAWLLRVLGRLLPTLLESLSSATDRKWTGPMVHLGRQLDLLKMLLTLFPEDYLL